MRHTNSSVLDILVTSLVTALLLFCAVRDTNTSVHDPVCTSLEATPFPVHLCAMRDTNSTLNSPIGTPLEAAPFCLSAVRDAYSSVHNLISAPHRPAFCFTSFFIRCNQRPTVAFFHLRRLLHLRLRLLLMTIPLLTILLRVQGHGRQAAIKTIRRRMWVMIFD
jgi:hypothetical protein